MKNIKTLFLLLSGVIASQYVISQGINFTEGDWVSIKEKSKAGNKIIFVDAYAEWCGPCKWLAKNVFTNDTVGKFYNANFICYSLDIEKGEGVDFAKEYKVKVMPTLLYIDSAGNMLHVSVGSRKVKEFIELGEIALNPEKRFSGFQKNYKSGNREPEFIRGYLKQLSETGQDVSEVSAWYFATQNESDMLSAENWEMIKKFVRYRDHKMFGYLMKNKDKYISVVGKEEVDNKICEVYKGSLRQALYQGKDSLYNEILTDIKNSDFEIKDKLILEANINYCQRKRDWKHYSEYTVQYVNKYLMDKNDKNLSMTLNQFAWTFYEQEEITDKELLKNAITWIKKSIELESSYYNTDTYAALLYKTGNKKEALKIADKAIELAKKGEQDFSATEELVKKIKAGK